MPRFHYKGLSEVGDADHGIVEGRDETEVFATLKAQGVLVYELAPADSKSSKSSVPWYAKDIALGWNGHKLADQAALAELLGLLSQLHLSATKMLEVAEESAPTRAIKRHLVKTRSSVADGRTISQAFNEAGTGFSPVFSQVLHAAELSNTLSQAMFDLARLLRRTQNVQAKIGSALIYPSILFTSIFCLVGVISIFLAPALSPMFEALNKPMPRVLATMMKIGEFFSNKAALLAPGVFLGCSVTFVLATTPQFATLRARVLLHLPLIGTILREGHLLAHVSTLGLLLRGGVKLPDALEGAGSLSKNSPYKTTFLAGAESLRQGGRALEGMRSEGRLPNLVLGLVAVGEEANKVEHIASILTDVLERSLERRIDRTMQLLTPMLTLFAGGVIGVVVYSVMGAILDVNTVAL